MDDIDAPSVILVIDDHTAVLTVIKRILESSGYAVITASNGAEGLNILMVRKGDVSAVVLDLHMPKLDGVDFAELIRIAWPNLPILIVSAHLDTARAVIERLRLTVLPKPFTMKGLLQAINTLVR